MEPHMDEQDEFRLSRLLDGDLPDNEAVELHARMASEPALRERFNALARINRLLERRRADHPAVDYEQFRDHVMSAVRTAAAPGTIRLTRWLQIGMPLAAAAAIALIVSVYSSAPDSEQIAERPPTAPGQLVVRFHRPEARVAETGEVHIAFTRSSELAEAIRVEDEINGRRPPSVYAAGASSAAPDEPMKVFIEAFPL